MTDGLGDKVKGDTREVGGKVQEGVGDITGDRDMQAEGEANQVRGKGEQVVGNVKDAFGNAKDKVQHTVDDATHKH